MSEEEKKIEDILIEGCVSDEARDEISQMLDRRLAELDPQGKKAQFILKLRNEVVEMPSCKTLINEEEKSEGPSCKINEEGKSEG